MAAKNRRGLAPPVLGSVSTVLAASLVSGAKTEFESWPPVRNNDSCRMPKNRTVVSLSAHEWLAHFSRSPQNWSADGLPPTPTDWQFRDRPGSHRELGCHQIAPT